MSVDSSTLPAASFAAQLRSRLADNDTLIVPTAHDVFAAKIILDVGFEAVFCNGYGLAASDLGRPDAGMLDVEVVVRRTATMAGELGCPVLVDADDGFEDAPSTFIELEAAGAAAVMIEDQVPEKQCGHIPGKQVIDADLMCERLEEVVAARQGETLLIARTDALDPLGIDAAISRGCAYADAGADAVFVEAPQSAEQLRRIAAEIPCHVVANMIPGGRTPIFDVSTLTEWGFGIVIYGLADLMVCGAALRSAFREMRASGRIDVNGTAMLTFPELNDVTGLAHHVRSR